MLNKQPNHMPLLDQELANYKRKSRADMEKEKLVMELLNLQLTYQALSKPPSKDGLISVILKILGNISAIFLLIIGITGPINKYYHQRVEEFKTPKLTQEIKKIIDSGDNKDSLKRSLLLQISLESPRTFAPIMLKAFNEFRLDGAILIPLYKDMYYFAQTDIEYETFLDRIAGFTEPSNANILEKDLAYAIKKPIDEFVSKEVQQGYERQKLRANILDYLTLIQDLDIYKNNAFQDALGKLAKNCQPKANDGICQKVNELYNAPK